MITETIHPAIKKILITEDEIKTSVKALGEIINNDYKGKEILLIGILKGSVVFMSDLMRVINIPCKIDFMAVSSYGNSTESSGEINIKKDLDTNIENKEVIIVEDILDTGNTLYKVRDYLYKRNPSSIKICTLFDKPERREANIKADYIGLTVPNEFIVGYGLDYAENFRNLPYIGVLHEHIYEK